MLVRPAVRSVLVGALLLALVATAYAAASPASVQRATGLERALVGAVNDARAARGLRPLKVSPGLRAAALSHSRAMVAAGTFAHESPDGTHFADRIRKLYPPRPNAAWAVGENLYSSSNEPTAEDAVKAWLASPPHRGIVLSPVYRDFGLGIVRATAAGGDFGGQPAWVITADFGTRTNGR